MQDSRPRIEGRYSVNDLPFDAGKLDDLLGQAGVDILLVTSKHNIQYLLGGYRYSFFDQFDALGISRYLPFLIYPRGRPEDAVYIGNAQEDAEAEIGRFWCPTVETTCWGTLEAVDRAIKSVRRLSRTATTVGAEFAFLPMDAGDVLRAELTGHRLVDAHLPLERLRSIKTADELRTQFDYCLLTAGTGFNRASSNQVIQRGDVISLDSGGSYGGYIGDLCRMGVVGEPDAELEDLLAGIEAIQQAARRPIKPGITGIAIFETIEPVLQALPDRDRTHFVAHGTGIIGHEAPRLSARGPVTYPAYDANLPLQVGMVLSIETTLMNSRRGYIKIEDTVVVTSTDWKAFGDAGRGWNVPRL